MISVEVQYAVANTNVPKKEDFLAWAAAVESSQEQEITLRIVDEQEMVQLNERYRKKAYPTNVLAFPAELPTEVEVPLLGDVVICAPVVNKEALEQGKSSHSHWAHMTVHGILHLQGYGHINDIEAKQMEAFEIKILHKLGFDNPYV